MTSLGSAKKAAVSTEECVTPANKIQRHISLGSSSAPGLLYLLYIATVTLLIVIRDGKEPNNLGSARVLWTYGSGSVLTSGSSSMELERCFSGGHLLLIKCTQQLSG